MAHYGILGQAEEDALHASRLMNVEDRHLKRLTRRLLGTDSPLVGKAKAKAEVASDQDEEEPQEESGPKELDLEQWKQDLFLDFAQFDSNVIRAQLVLSSNARERQRYAEEKIEIQSTAQTVKENNAALHADLKRAQGLLEVRKSYDKLTEKITRDQTLRPREEQHANIEKLKAEIADLEAEGQEYGRNWADRRTQFSRIVEEGKNLQRLIRDDQEEAERKEGMEDGSEEQGFSRGATPAGGATPIHVPSGEPQSPARGSRLKEETLAVEPLAPQLEGNEMVVDNASALDQVITRNLAEASEDKAAEIAVQHSDAPEAAASAVSVEATPAVGEAEPQINVNPESMDTT